jgi:hypothetical protein
MKGRIALLGIALILVVLQPSFAQEAAQEVQEAPLIDVATAVANILRSEEVTGSAESFRAGLATSLANISGSLQSRAYDDATGYTDKIIKAMLGLMEDPGFAALKGSEFEKSLIAFAESIPTMVFGSLRDPLQFGVVESFISVFVMFNNLVASLFSMNILAAIFSVIENSPYIIARSPMTLQPLYGLFFEGIPVVIEAVMPIVLTSVFKVFLDLSNIVSKMLSADEGMWFSVFTTPFNALMDILSVWQNTLFYIMRGSLSAFASLVSLAVSSPRVFVGLLVSVSLALPILLFDMFIAFFLTYLPGLLLSIGLSVLIGLLNFFALAVASTGLDLTALGFSAIEGGLDTVSKWLLTALDFFDLKSLRNVVEVTSEGVANLL